MRNRKIMVFGVILLLVLSSSTTLFFVSVEGSGEDNSIEKSSPEAIGQYTSHQPIRINGDSNFTSSNGVSNPAAAGTEADPYIIENWSINGTGYGYCIYIGNTTDHFIVRNCSLHNSDGVLSEPYYYDTGLILYNVTSAIVDNNTMSDNNRYGIGLTNSSYNNTIRNNMLSCNNVGFSTLDSNNNTVFNNTMIENTNFGVALWFPSKNNTLYHNNFIENNYQAADEDGDNNWNSTYPTGGNYWSDYDGVDNNSTASQDVPPSDGIGDTHYTDIISHGTDYYPLMNPTIELPNVTSVSPLDGTTGISAFEPYNILFSKTMNSSYYPSIDPQPIPESQGGGSWAWDSTGRWCNYTGTGGPMWNSGTRYEVNVTGLVDKDGLPLSGDTHFNFTIDGVAPVVFDITGTPLENVSTSNPIQIEAKVNESGEIMMNGTLFMRYMGGNATLDNYTIIEQVGGSLDPTVTPDVSRLSTVWNTTSGYGPDDDDAGYLTDGTDEDYLRVWSWQNGTGDWNTGAPVYFSNSTLTKEEAQLQFKSDGSPQGLWINGSGQQVWIDPVNFDYSMKITPRVDILSFDNQTDELKSSPWETVYGEYGHTYWLPDVYFIRDHVVPSGEYPWAVFAIDGGLNIGFNKSDTPVTIVNSNPEVLSKSPSDGAQNVSANEPYRLHFSREMNTSLEPTIEPSPMQGSWVWDSTGTWCNFTVSGDFPILWEGGTKYWVNVTDLADHDGLSVIGDASFNFTIVSGNPLVTDVTGAPLENVSLHNPIDVRATIKEPHLDMGLAIFLKDIGGNTTLDNYTIIEEVQGTLKQADYFANTENLSATWNATSGYDSYSTAGYLTDGTNQDYMEISRWWDDSNSEYNYGFNVYYTNNTLTKERANLQFHSDGSPKGLWVNGSGQQVWIDPGNFDSSMSIIPRVDVISFNKTTGELVSPVGGGYYGEYGHEYSLPDVSFEVDHLVPSDTYPWFVAGVDEGWNIGYNMSDTPVSVDNTPPTIISSTHANGATGVSTDAGEYNIHFSEPINTTHVLVSTDLPNATWTWSADNTWLNGTYSQLEGGKHYYIDINNVEDFAKNWLPYDKVYRNFTAAAPWATITGPESDGTNNGTPTLTYDYGNNPFEVVIWYSTDGGETWDQKIWDKPADGVVVLNKTSGLPGSGIYHFSARATGEIDEPVPNSTADIEGGAYVLDMDDPYIESTTPENWEWPVDRSEGTYVIEFSEKMDTTKGTIDSTLPDVEWEWDDTGRWLNGTYAVLDGETNYYVNLTGFEDLVGNEMTGNGDHQFYAERGPWAQAGWAFSDGSYNRRPEVKYSVSNATSVEIYYTDDGGTTWNLWGTDENANGSWMPDSDLPATGTYNWNCRAMGYVDEPVPDGPEFVESEDFLLLESSETVEIESTIPEDGETGVGLNADNYAIKFTVDMQKKGSINTNLPNVSLTWRYDGRWLNCSYDELEPSTTYYVDLESGGFQSISGAYVSGDMNNSFTTRSEDETPTGSISGQVTDVNGDPISGATVTLPGTDLTTTTDENGNYLFEDVPVGHHNITITHPDYETQKDSVDLSEGETAETDQIPMEDKEEGSTIPILPIILILVIAAVIVVVAIMMKRKSDGSSEKVEDNREEVTDIEDELYEGDIEEFEKEF